MKKPKNIILLVNLILVLTLFAYENTHISLTEATHIIGLFILNIVIGLVYVFMKNSERGKIYFLSAFLVLLIGFGVCTVKEKVYPPWGSQSQFKK